MNPSIALTLSAAARLQLAFHASAGPLRLKLVDCAADCLDRTKPDPSILCYHREAEAQGADQVAVLVRCHALLNPLPPSQWPQRRVRPSQWPREHADALRALERFQKGEVDVPQARLAALAQWLAPAWERYPQLREAALTALGQPVG